MRNLYLLSCVVCVLFINACKQAPVVKSPDYLNTQLSFETRAHDLVSRMTLDEKISQLRYDALAIDRLHVPAYNWWNECLHGVARSGYATVYPEPIGLASMWNRDMMFDIATQVSDEARVKYQQYSKEGKRAIYQGLTFWTPNLNIFRDPRWGRGMETYGEDPYLTGELAVPFIKGLQGDDPKYFKVISTVKHFAVHSGPESTRHSADVYPTDYDLNETYLPQFKKAIMDAHAYSVMCAYQRLEGEPCCGSHYLSDLLRNKWNFKGYIVSDCWALNDFFEKQGHHVVNTQPEAAAKAIKAGTDLNCGETYQVLGEAVKQGLVDEAIIDTSVQRLMLARMKLGLFDPDSMVKYTKIPDSVLNSKTHDLLACNAAKESMVLLKNDNHLLPFSKNIKRVAVIGPNANNTEVLLGNYNGYAINPITPFQGIKEKLPQAQVHFAQGCKLASELPYLTPIPSECLFTDETMKEHGLHGDYYDGIKCEGTIKHTRIDTCLDFIWGNKAPFSDLNDMEYSIVWTGVLVPPSTGEYAIGSEALKGCRLYFNDSLVTKRMTVHEPMKQSANFHLIKGEKYKIRIEYVQNYMEYAIMHLLWDSPKPNLKAEALDLARNSDVVVLCMGLSPELEGEEMPVHVKGFSGGDRVDIGLPDSQSELIREVQALGKPMVLVLLNGSALAINWESKNVSSILEAWYPGQEGGRAIADILFGDYNPAGRLPVTMYKSIDQISAFTDYNMQGKTYRYFKGKPLYAFGYGLSYTSFNYQIKNIPTTVQTGHDLPVSVLVKNTGKYDGDEVVQVYLSLTGYSEKTAIRSLVGFQRIHLTVGEQKEVSFTISPQQMSILNKNNDLYVNPGTMQITIGDKSQTVKISGKAVMLP